MKFDEAHAFQGPNLSAPYPVARWVVSDLSTLDITNAEHDRAQRIFREGVRPDGEELMLNAHQPATLLAELLLRLQQAGRHPVDRFQVHPLQHGQIELVVEVLRPSLLSRLGDLAQAFWDEWHGNTLPGSFARCYQDNRERLSFQLSELLRYDRLRWALRLGIPAREGSGSRIWLGQGAGLCLVSGGHSASTSRMGRFLSEDKAQATRLMLTAGLPAAEQREARNEQEALAAAVKLGYPVVIKPRNGSKGRGVAVNLKDAEAVREGYAMASIVQSQTVVERFLPGDDHRLLVVNGRMIAAVRRLPAAVLGDGRQTIAKLIDQANRAQRRDGLYLCPINVDMEIQRLLIEQGKTLESVPVAGEQVVLRRAANQSLGGTTLDVTDQVHPDNCSAAVTAAAICQLDVAGIDWVSRDIGVSWLDGEGGIVEINSGPGVDLHLAPTVGSARPVSPQLMRCNFPPEADPGQRVIAVLGQYWKAKTARNLGRIARQQGYYPSLLLRDGIHRPDRIIPVRGQLLDLRHRVAELDPNVDTVIAEWPSDPLALQGSPIPWLDSLILTDALTRSDFDEKLVAPNVLQRLRRMAVNLASRSVVMDGADEGLWQELAGLPTGLLRPYWTRAQGTLPESLQRHVALGGLLLHTSEDGLVIHHEGEREVYPWTELPVLPWHDPEAISPILAGLASFFPIARDARKAQLTQMLTPPPTPTWVSTWHRDGRWRAAVDPRDKGITHGIGQWIRDNQDGRLWLLWDGNGDPPAVWNSNNNQIQTRNIGQGVLGQPTLAQALAEAESQMIEGDGILLLLANEVERLRSFRELRGAEATTPGRYRELAKIFGGRWVNGTWLADQALPCRTETIGPCDQLVVVPDGVEAFPALKARLLAAFQRGARGAIAAALPEELPRWWPVIVCDDPLAGWHRFGKQYPQLQKQLFVIADQPL